MLCNIKQAIKQYKLYEAIKQVKILTGLVLFRHWGKRYSIMNNVTNCLLSAIIMRMLNNMALKWVLCRDIYAYNYHMINIEIMKVHVGQVLPCGQVTRDKEFIIGGLSLIKERGQLLYWSFVHIGYVINAYYNQYHSCIWTTKLSHQYYYKTWHKQQCAYAFKDVKTINVLYTFR